MEIFLQAQTWIALLTLLFLEIVLGIDNIVFISIVSNKLKENVHVFEKPGSCPYKTVARTRSITLSPVVF